MIVEVLIEIKAYIGNRSFSYHVPSNLESQIMVGKRVLVPFQNRHLEGFIMEINDKAAYETKDIIAVIDEKPVLNAELFALGKYLAKKTLCSLINAYETMLPVALKAHNVKKVKKKMVSFIIANHLNTELTVKQQALYDLVKSEKKVKKSTISSKSILKTLLLNGVLKEVFEEEYRLQEHEYPSKENFTLTAEQSSALECLSDKLNTFTPFLLHGVTGSGKTLVYIELIRKVLNEGKETIVLVPEISLTPQLVSRFKSFFPKNIAVLHSGLSAGEKYDEWRKIEAREVKIVIGARSAIFAPFTNLGLIVIDEEHSETYKQENTPRYSAIDVALWRAKYHKCEVVLGSATPSVESYTRVLTKTYTLVEMKKRVNDNPPKTYLIDMKEEIKNGYRILAKTLIEAINSRLLNHEQVIILLNRRGYATNVTCHDCGFTLKCPACDIPLIYHKSSETMRCHYCGYGCARPHVCPSCHSKNIDYFGLGTQKLEEELKRTFDARIVRMDVDTTSKKGAHAKIIDDFINEKYDILVGTQMIAKGLDFPNVTLVGVINGDASLNVPDFRAGERTFQLLNQIAGRSGRSSKKGEVYIQVFNKEHYSILDAANNDYEAFIKEELALRKKLKYPPYYNLLLIKMASVNLDLLKTESAKVGAFLREDNAYTVLGPAPSQMAKMNNVYYYQIIVKYKKRSEVEEKAAYLKNQYSKNRALKIDIDFNPLRV